MDENQIFKAALKWVVAHPQPGRTNLARANELTDFATFIVGAIADARTQAKREQAEALKLNPVVVKRTPSFNSSKKGMKF